MFTIRTPDGELQTVTCLDGYEDCEVVAEHNRAPREHEEWCANDGRWKVNDARKADTDAGSEHKARAHAQKALEAALILSGVQLTHGLIAEEAAALGVDVGALAARIHDKSAGMREIEIGRRLRKSGSAGRVAP